MENRDEKIEAVNGLSAAESCHRTTKRLRMELMKTIVFILAALAVIVIGTMAWFTANMRVQSGAASVSAQFELIRIASKGERQSAEAELLKLPVGEVFSYGGDAYYSTDGGTIALRLSEEYIISPGASGSVTFYIIPTRDGAMEATLYLSMAGYAGNIGENGEVTSVSRLDDTVLETLLNGHILLFRRYENGHYSDWISSEGTDGALNYTITVTLPETAKADEPFEVTLYWIWPLRYANMVDDLYESASPEYADRFKPFVEAQAGESLTAMPVTTGYYYSRLFLTKKTTLGDAESRSQAYNLADEYIGTQADYLYLTVQTEACG